MYIQLDLVIPPTTKISINNPTEVMTWGIYTQFLWGSLYVC